MSPESTKPVRAPRAGRISGLIPTSRHKDQANGQARTRPKRKKRKPQSPTEQERPEQEQPPNPDEAGDEHEVDYLA